MDGQMALIKLFKSIHRVLKVTYDELLVKVEFK